MTRIFVSLALLSTVALAGTFWLGWRIGDARSPDIAIQGRVTLHFLVAVGAICFGVLVHALVLTYFMGTGRWLEETCRAYHLGPDWQQKNRDLKWGLYPAMILGLTLLIVTGAFGAAADPASAFGFEGFGAFPARQVHLGIALITLVLNALVNVFEFRALRRNGQLVGDVLARVRQMRVERGLAV